ncbi:hypothetical protein ACIP79_42245 [Streptomyces sp. NPDC088747]|uniref:hypothetical protein n=1 Tax=Streptomyces sp. NPDC088747 TaxID=3365886 RepID=UPI00380C2A97
MPGALTRARSTLVRDPAFATDAKARLVETIAEEQRVHERRQTELQEQLAALRTVADPLRDGLVFGTGRALEDAVHDVLVAVGAAVTATTTCSAPSRRTCCRVRRLPSPGRGARAGPACVGPECSGVGDVVSCG